MGASIRKLGRRAMTGYSIIRFLYCKKNNGTNQNTAAVKRSCQSAGLSMFFEEIGQVITGGEDTEPLDCVHFDLTAFHV